jgi:hypothetical protein
MNQAQNINLIGQSKLSGLSNKADIPFDFTCNEGIGELNESRP